MRKKLQRSKRPPAGWPTEKEWQGIEKEITKTPASRILPRDAGPVERMKQDLCAHFVRYCQDEKISQRELARTLDVSESRISEIVHYNHQRFTIDKLLELLSVIKPNLKIMVA